MPATLDLSAVRHFADSLDEQMRECDNGEGMVCSTLDQSINHYAGLCQALREYINGWARAIFTGQAAPNAEVETLLKTQAQQLLRRAKKVAAQGRAMDRYCWVLQGLNTLHCHIADFDYLLENWVSPQPAVRPAPRVKVPSEAGQQIAEHLAKLQPMAADCCSSDGK